MDVENLTDAELRSKLMEFGFPVMPITGTTRKVMKKKLKLLLENKDKNRDGRRSLGRFSSEEESDSDSVKVPKREKRRVTMAAPTMQPPRRTPDIPPKKMVTTTSTRTTKMIQTARDEYETGSESDEVAEKYESEVKESPPRKLPASFLSASQAADAASERLSSIRARYSTSFYKEDASSDKESTPFLSNFTKRLSQLSESPKNNVYDYKNDVIKENDVNGGGGTSSRVLLNRNTRGRPSTYDYKLTNQSIFKNNFVPFIVLVLAVLFFLIVAIVYLGIRSDTSLEVAVVAPVCVPNDVRSRRNVNCVLENEKKPTLHFLQVLKPELERRSYRNKCEDNSKPYMTEEDIVEFITKNFAIQDRNRVLTDLKNVQILSFFNPNWSIKILQMTEDGAHYIDTKIAKDMDEVIENRESKVIALMVINPYIPWSCYFYNTFWTFFSVLISLTGGITLLAATNYIYRFYKQLKQKQQDEEMTIVENIIDILQTNAANENEVNYMVINHVRDMILPINQRKSKQKQWAQAVKYIYENESRIRTEEKDVQGELTEIWRWLGGNTNLNASKNKSWQGQAFETQVGSVNSLPCSPTPCLKIRGMVEEGDRNTVGIRKAVLSKCALECKILHCTVDLNSKCVYLKCADQNDAAVAYRNLHGWWYAGNLVTVKYLRLERYMQRFPDSAISGPPFLT